MSKRFEIVKLEQGSAEWKTFRRSHVCATDASVVLGCNPWKTIDQLLKEKVEGIDTPENDAMRRGKELEPIALDYFEREHGIPMFPCVVKHTEIPYMAASLDGMSLDSSSIVEIKCNGRKNHNLAFDGIIPFYYMAQIQHQLECTGLDKAYYFSFDGEKGITIEVRRDPAMINIILEKEKKFWNEMQSLKLNSDNGFQLLNSSI